MIIKKIEQIMPSSLYSTYYFIYKNSIKRIKNFIRKNKLKKFKTSEIKNINFKGINFKIKLDPKNGYVDEEIYLNDIYEPHILQIFKENIKPEQTFLDIGGNIGLHSIFVANLNKNTNSVITFEPIKRLYKQINKNIEINNLSNVKVYNYACGLEEDEQNINIDLNNIGGSSLKTNSKIKEKIKIVNLDSFLKENIDFVKIDVEGFEPEVIFGMKKIIEKNKPKIILEYSENLSKKKDLIKMLKFFYDLDYQIVELRENKKRNLSYFKNNFKYKQTNLFLTRKNEKNT